MPDFKGRLTVINGQSSLNNDLLLRAGLPDATQAIFAATQFLLKTVGLISGQAIIVTGNKGSLGDVSVIVMTSARADPAQPFALGAHESAFAEALPSSPATTKRRAKKSGRERSATASRKSGSKPSASKKGAVARKRVAAKSSTKK